MYILDTDLLSILQHPFGPVFSLLESRMGQHDRGDFYITVVTSHEQVMGAHNYIAKAMDRAKIIRGYQMIEAAMIDYHRFRPLSFDDPAAIRFDDLRKQKVRIGTMDLRIASIALSHDFTVLTRNTVDFEKVPGLRVENWTVA